MKDFAKLFWYEEYGQVLVVRDDFKDGPGVQIYYQPKGLGICKTGVTFEDTDDGRARADKAFDFVTEEGLKPVIEEQFKEARKFVGGMTR